MAEKDKTALESFAAAFLLLPEEKRQYLQGVADGMAAMVTGGLKRLEAQTQAGRSGSGRREGR